MPDPPSVFRSDSAPSRLRAGNIEFLRKQAKALLRAYKRGNPHAQLRIGAIFPRHHGVPSRAGVGLAEAQLTLARELGFSSWSKLVRELEHPSDSSQPAQHSGDQTMTTQTSNSLGLSAIDQIGLSCTDLDE